MARITIEDCLEKIPSHFDVVKIAARRAFQLEGGAPLRIEKTNNTSSINALREIADGKVGYEILNPGGILSEMSDNSELEKNLQLRGEEAKTQENNLGSL